MPKLKDLAYFDSAFKFFNNKKLIIQTRIFLNENERIIQ